MKASRTVVAVVLATCLSGCQVHPPGKFETRMAELVKRRLTVGGRADKNPFPDDAKTIERGRKNFSYYCASCHGLDGQNTGVPFASAMSPPVPLLNSTSVQRYSDGQLKSVIDNGISPSGMPASRGILNDDEIWQIVAYLRHLPQKGTLGEPLAYGGGASTAKPPQPRTD